MVDFHGRERKSTPSGISLASPGMYNKDAKKQPVYRSVVLSACSLGSGILLLVATGFTTASTLHVTMVSSVPVLLLGALAAANALPSTLASRASCTFSDAASAIKGKTSCSTITLSGITVPPGTTLDLTGLNDGTHVIFTGTTTFGYKEWSGPLISVSGNNILVEGASGHVIDGNGAAWWDGKGSNGGKTKPKYGGLKLSGSQYHLLRRN